MRTLFLRATKTISGIGLIFGVFIGWLEWDVHKVRELCNDVRPGMSIISLRSLAEEHAVDVKWVNPLNSERSDGKWVLYVPVEATMGDVDCVIRHDQKIVLSAKMNGDD
jgi:hypothetical protein